MVQTMRIKTSINGESKTQSFSNVLPASNTDSDIFKGVKAVAQKIVALSQRVYGSTDYVRTWQIDGLTKEVFNDGDFIDDDQD